MSQSKTKKTTRKQKKPIRLAKRWGAQVLPMAAKILPTMFGIVLLGLMFTSLQAIDTYWLRVALSLGIASGMVFLLYAEGLNRGLMNVSSSRSYVQGEADGRALTAKDDAACYHPLKALCAALVAFGIPLVLSVYLAMNAREYTYSLQSLPLWLTQTYGARSDVMAPLAAYQQMSAMAALDWVRMFVRLFELIFINLFEDPQKMTASIDRLSPLMISVLPIAYMIGYLSSPSQTAKQDKQNRRAKKIAVRRAERRKVGPELLGNQPQVHYGHKKEEKARKKKELI